MDRHQKVINPQPAAQSPAHRIVIDPDTQLAVVTLRGVLTLDDVKAAIDALLEHPEHVEHMKDIWDFREASVAPFDRESLLTLANHVSELLPRLGKRTALVVATDLDYGIIRMWEAYAEMRAPRERHLCRSFEEARNWLGL